MTGKIMISSLAALFLTAAVSQASVWEADPVHSSVQFKVKHLMVSNVKGTFDQFDVNLIYEENDVAKSSVEATIQAGSINTENEKRDAHLKSADFLDVEKYPTITFKSRRIENVGEGKLKIVGDLTIRGVTKEVALNVTELTPPMADPWGGVRMGATATTRIDRTEYGVSWNQILEAGGVVVGNNVDITIELELMKKP